jgi:nicotinate-nucleotide adenylyltransferase
LTARWSPRTKKKIRERIVYAVRGLDPLWAGSTFLGVSLTTAQAHRTAAKHHPRRVALFGGSFDPIHNGHLSVARAADRRFNFDELHLIPASRPPHKLKQHLAPFPHRFAMVALACTEHPHFVPSLAEAGEDFSGAQLHYSVDTVRYFRHVYHGHGDRLFFMIGADAFLDIPTWKEYETLLGLCDFIIANRPGIRPEALRLVIPPDLIARPDAKKEAEPPSQIVAQLHRTTIYLLENIASDVSATEVRRHAHRGQSIHRLVSACVEEYILKQGLYR